MDEKYIQQLYQDLAKRYGANKIMPYDTFVSRITSDTDFQKQTYNDFSKAYGADKILSFDNFSGKVKKKADGSALPQNATGSSTAVTNDPNATLKLSDMQAGQPQAQPGVDVNNLNAQHGKLAAPTEGREQAAYGGEVAKENIGQRNAAIDNTLKREYKNLGIKVDKNSKKYQDDFQSKLQLLQSGDIVTTKSKSGEPTTTRGTGFFETAGYALVNSFKAPMQAAKLQSMHGKELADYLDKINSETPEIPISEPSGLAGALGEAAGGFPKTAGLLGVNELVPFLGTALASAEAHLSSTGVHTMDMYQRNLQAFTKAGMPMEEARIQAANKAQRDANIAAIPDAIMTGALGEMGGEVGELGDAAKTFKSALVKSGKSIGKFGALGGAAGAAEKGIELTQGYDLKFQDVVDNFGKEGFQYATMDAMFKFAPLVSKMPAAMHSAWLNYMSKVPEPMISDLTAKMGTQGEQVKKEIDDYKTADAKVPDHFSDEKRVALTSLQHQKDKLTEDNENGQHDKQLEQIGNAMKTVETSKNAHAIHIDPMTGESEGRPKDFEQLSAAQKKGIKVPDDYGEVEVKQVGEGEEKKFVAKAKVKTQDGSIELFQPIKIEGNFKDKGKAKEAGEQALRQHFYENGLADNFKPEKGSKQEEADLAEQDRKDALHEAGKPKIELDPIAPMQFYEIGKNDPDLGLGAKRKQTDILRRKNILDKLIDCL